MSDTIVFIHGAWLASNSWERFSEFFSERGYATVAPEWFHYEERRGAGRGHAETGLQKATTANPSAAPARATPIPLARVGA